MGDILENTATFFFAEKTWDTRKTLIMLCEEFEISGEVHDNATLKAVFIRCKRYYHGGTTSVDHVPRDVEEYERTGALPYTVRYTAHELLEYVRCAA